MVLRASYVVLRIKPGLAACNASALIPVLCLWPHDKSKQMHGRSPGRGYQADICFFVYSWFVRVAQCQSLLALPGDEPLCASRKVVWDTGGK